MILFFNNFVLYFLCAERSLAKVDEYHDDEDYYDDYDDYDGYVPVQKPVTPKKANKQPPKKVFTPKAPKNTPKSNNMTPAAVTQITKKIAKVSKKFIYRGRGP